MSQVNEQAVDLNALLKEVGGEVDELIKTEQARLEALKKNEESSMKKEESSSKEQSMKKDEGSGFESPAPAADASAQQSSAAPADASAQPGAEDQGESLQSMVQGLDDEMLQELMQVVQMEMEGRSKSASPAPSPMDAAASPAPAAPAASPDMSMGKAEASMAMHKKELEAVKEKLAKSEKQAENVEKAFVAMTDLMEKIVNRPVTKAITDIRNVDFVDKGEKDLKKNEQETISDEEFQKRAKKLATDRNELGKLTKNERESLSSYFVTKRRSPEVLKLISK